MQNLFLPEIDYNAPAEYNMPAFAWWDLKNSSSPDWFTIDNCFSPQECLEIIKIGKIHAINESKTGDGRPFSDIRKSKNSWIPPSEISQWIFLKIQEKINDVNHHFEFDLHSIENLQFTEYDCTYTGYYGKHIDKFPSATSPGSYRKLSFSLQLSNSCDYEGGDLLLYNGKEPIYGNKKMGSINFFPSYLLHEVTPVTKGKRYALVSWIHGPKFK